ncbi:hypothetical protein LIER_30449 [Lithospermum erythrorhizon]|uniref:Uncharacterized protein n=1 Tax=Lithospermum erythrorhizon TaxID=34254 RepID=A0AAV3RPK6_LITER
MDDEGQVFTEPPVVEDKIIKFYEFLFTSKGPSGESQKMVIRSFIMRFVPVEDFEALVAQSIMLHRDKICHDVLDSFQYIFATGDVPTIVNATTFITDS